MHQNRAILCGCGGDFEGSPKLPRDSLRPQDARFPLRRKSLANCDFFCEENFQGEIIYAPPPLPPFWPEGIFEGGEGGVYLNPPTAGFLYAPLFYTPPAPSRVFSGVSGWGCIKIGPPKLAKTVLAAEFPAIPSSAVQTLIFLSLVF